MTDYLSQSSHDDDCANSLRCFASLRGDPLPRLPAKKSSSFHFESDDTLDNLHLLPGNEVRRAPKKLTNELARRDPRPYAPAKKSSSFHFGSDDMIDRLVPGGKEAGSRALEKLAVAERGLRLRGHKKQAGNDNQDSVTVTTITITSHSTPSPPMQSEGIVKTDNLANRVIEFCQKASSSSQSSTSAGDTRDSTVVPVPPISSTPNTQSQTTSLTADVTLQNLTNKKKEQSNSDRISLRLPRTSAGNTAHDNEAASAVAPVDTTKGRHSLDTTNNNNNDANIIRKNVSNPPPPPPPRPTSTSSSGRPNPPPAPPRKLLHGPAPTPATQHDVDVSKSLAVARKLGAYRKGGSFHNNAASSFNSEGSKESGDRDGDNNRRRSDGEIGVAPPPSSSSAGAKVNFQMSNSDQTGGNIKGVHKNGHGNSKGNNSQVMELISNLSTHNEEEASEFKKCCSLSLSEFEASSSNIGDTRDNRDDGLSYNKNSVCDNHDFNNSSTSFTPRPVKISQFKDNDQDNTSTSKGSTTTTPAESSKTPIESLPDNVDKKGRCIKHPNVKLFKKKILGGYYEMIKDVCPQCEKEAPYEEMWRERAKLMKGSRVKGVDDTPDSHCKGSIQARSGSIDSTRFKERNSLSKERERKSSRSNERGTVERGTVATGHNNKLADESTASLPYVPFGNDDEEEEVQVVSSSKASRTRGRSRGRSPPPPPPPRQGGLQLPPPPLHQKPQGISVSEHSTIPPPLPRRRRSSFGRDTVRSQSASRRGRSPSSGASDNPNPTTENKSIFDKGKGKLSSLHNRVRCRSRSLSRQRSKNSFSKEPPSSSSHKDSARESYKSQEMKFDKKTGRCKVHPSIILAKKSTFQKGWDMTPGGCPLCNETRANNVISPNNERNDVDSRSTNRSPRKMSSKLRNGDKPFRQNSPAHNSQEIVDNMISSTEDNEPARVSRMPYATPWGESGWYTGFVNSSGQPHGKGRMRCKTGKSSDGEWVNGYSEEYLENQGKMKRGFGTNVAKWKENDTNGRRVTGSSGQMPSKSSSTPQQNTQSGEYQAEYQGSGYQGQYQHQAYYPTSYGMAPYSQHLQVGAMPSPGGTWIQSLGYHYQSPGGQRHHVPAYQQGFHQT